MKNATASWMFFAAVIVFWVTLDLIFGVRDVRNALRGGVAVLLLFGVVVVLADRLVVAFQTKFPPAHPHVAYHPIFARSADGKIADGYVVGLLCEGKKGYSPQLQHGTFADTRAAQRKADELNAQAGISNGEINRLINRWA